MNQLLLRRRAALLNKVHEVKLHPTSLDSSRTLYQGSGYPSNGYYLVYKYAEDNSSGDYRINNSQNSNAYITYFIDCSIIPRNVTILSVECAYSAKRDGNCSSTTKLMCGNIVKSEESAISGSGGITVMNDAGIWTRDELDSCAIMFSINPNNLQQIKYMWLHGATLTVTYKKRILPYDSEIEYLESSGTQYIDTGIQPTSSIGIKIKYSTDSVQRKVVTGSYITETTIGGYNYQDNRNFIRINANLNFGVSNAKYDSELDCPSIITANDIYVIDTIIGSNRLSLTVNNATYTKNHTAIYNPIPIYLFANNTIQHGQHVAEPDSHRVYYTQYYNPDNDNIIMDLIPVRIGQIGYMYDKVSGQLFGNSGTGNFILGPDKN